MMPSDISEVFLNPIPRRLANHDQHSEKGYTTRRRLLVRFHRFG